MIITKEQLKTLHKNAPAGTSLEDLQIGYIKKGFEIEGVDTAQAKQYIRQKESNFTLPVNEVEQPEPEQPKSGFLNTVGGIAKDVADTLVVKPALRAGQAIGGTISQAVIDAMPDTDPRKAQYQANLDKSLSETTKVPVFGDIEAQKAIGEGGGRQIMGEALKTASYLIPYGKLATAGKALTGSKLAGNVISGVTGGYTADVGYGLADENKTMGEAFTPGVGTAIGAAIPLAGPVLRATGRVTQKVGEKLTDAVIPASTREAGILQTYKANNPFMKRVLDVLQDTSKTPQTAGKTVLEKGLMGTKSQIGIQAKRATDKLWSEVISPRLKQATVQVDLDGFFNKIGDDIVNSTDDLTRQKSLMEGLQAIKDDYAGVNTISLEKLQKLKESWAKFLPSKAFRGQEIGGAVNEVRRLLSKEARQTIYNTLGDDVKMAYLDYGNLHGIKEMGISSMTGQKLKGGAGSFISEVANQAITPVGTIAGQGIYRIGQGIEFIGKLGAKNLGQALGITKFPGDAMVDDIGARVKQAKSIPNKQGGFIRVGQEAKAPMTRATTQTANKMSKTSISPKSTTKGLKGKGEIPETNLISEAKKYKSAEEFVKAQGKPVYHGTNKEFSEFISTPYKTKSIDFMGNRIDITRKGAWLTPSKKYATSYGNTTKEFFGHKLKKPLKANDLWAYSEELTRALNPVIKKEGNREFISLRGDTIWIERDVDGLIDISSLEQFKSKNGIKEILFDDARVIESLEKDGFDGAIVQQGKRKTPAKLVFNPKSLKTKSQLTDIWNKANKGNDLISEAKKYKSAEEFVKAKNNEYVYHTTTNSGIEGIIEKGLTKDVADIYPHGQELEDSIGKMIYFADNLEATQNAGTFKTGNIIRIKKVNLDPNKMVDRPMFKRIETRYWGNDLSPADIEIKTSTGWENLLDYAEENYPDIIRQMKKENLSWSRKEQPIVTKSQLTDIWNKANKK